MAKRSKWTAFDPLNTKTIPDCPGVYVVYSLGEVVYVGSSVRMRHRASSHIRRTRFVERTMNWRDIPGVTGKYKVTSRHGDWAMLELRLLHRLKPRDNVRDTRHRIGADA